MLPPTGWKVSGSSSSGDGAESHISFSLVQESADPDPRWKKWDTLVSFQVTRMPARDAVKQLFLLIGETDIVMPEKLTGMVTINAQNKPFVKVFELVSQQTKPHLGPEMRKKITLRPF